MCMYVKQTNNKKQQQKKTTGKMLKINMSYIKTK